MKNKKGFTKEQVLIISFYEMNDKFRHLFLEKFDGFVNDGFNKYHSEFEPSGKEDYSDTFKMENVEKYYQDQMKNNNYVGSFKEFIEVANLEMDIWFIKSGYDFTGIKTIIIDY